MMPSDSPVSIKASEIRILFSIIVRLILSLLVGLFALSIFIRMRFSSFGGDDDPFQMVFGYLSVHHRGLVLILPPTLLFFFLLQRWPWRRIITIFYILIVGVECYFLRALGFAGWLFRFRQIAFFERVPCPSVEEITATMPLDLRTFGVPLLRLMEWRSSPWLLLLYCFLWAAGTTAILYLLWRLLRNLFAILRRWRKRDLPVDCPAISAHKDDPN